MSSSSSELSVLQQPYSATSLVESASFAENRLLSELRTRNRALRAQIKGTRDAERAAAQQRARSIATSGPDTIIVEDWRADDLALKKRAAFNAVTARCAALEAEKVKLRGEILGYEMMAGPGGLTTGGSASSTHVLAPPSIALGNDKESAEAAGLGAGLSGAMAKLRAASHITRDLRALKERLEDVALGEDKRIAALVLVVEGKERARRSLAVLTSEAENARAAARYELAYQRDVAHNAVIKSVCEEAERTSMAGARVAHTQIALARAMARSTILAKSFGTRGLQNEGILRARLAASRDATSTAQKSAESARRKLEAYAQVRGWGIQGSNPWSRVYPLGGHYLGNKRPTHAHLPRPPPRSLTQHNRHGIY
jgi:hypothetical protein